MTQRETLRDMVVIVPGIVGSRLVRRDGTEIWGFGGGIVRNLIQPSHTLTLRGDGYAPEPDVQTPSVVGSLASFPGLSAVDGYGRIQAWLRQRFLFDEGQLLCFPYDWRLSCRVNGRLLADEMERALDRWRRRAGRRDAELILIGHSMGGLVARWFLDRCGGEAVTRRLITVGTPYFGSVDVLGILSGGSFGKVPWAGKRLARLARTFPSVYELLPRYPAIIDADDELVPLSLDNGPDLDRRHFGAAALFHSCLIHEWKRRRSPPHYSVHALVGTFQPTAQYARCGPRRVRLLREHKGSDRRGDGRVPTQSICPPEFPDEAGAVTFPQAHAGLPNAEGVLQQLQLILSAQPRPPQAPAGFALAVDIPEVALERDPIPLDVEGKVGGLALRAVVETVEERGREKFVSKVIRNLPVPRRKNERDRFAAQVPGLPVGDYRVTVGAAAASAASAVQSVSTVVTVLPRLAGDGGCG